MPFDLVISTKNFFLSPTYVSGNWKLFSCVSRPFRFSFLHIPQFCRRILLASFADLIVASHSCFSSFTFYCSYFSHSFVHILPLRLCLSFLFLNVFFLVSMRHFSYYLYFLLTTISFLFLLCCLLPFFPLISIQCSLLPLPFPSFIYHFCSSPSFSCSSPGSAFLLLFLFFPFYTIRSLFPCFLPLTFSSLLSLRLHTNRE